MKNKLPYMLLLGILIVLTSAVLFTLDKTEPVHSKKDYSSATSSPSHGHEDDKPLPKKGEPITVTGAFTCLTHKDTSGPVTMECAFGLKTADGTTYALKTDDPVLLGTLSMSPQVQISGMLVPAETSSKYQSSGTISVVSAEAL